MLSAPQRTVAKQAAIALVLSLGFILGAYNGLPWSAPELPTVGERLAFGIRCEVFASLMLLAGVVELGNRRFRTPTLVHGEAPSTGAGAVDAHYLQNTLEQFVLAAVAHLGLLATKAPQAPRLVPILVGWWVIARASFWIGYRHDPMHRAFGFAATFYPTVAVLAWTAWLTVAS
jgi:hypothetical protein